MKVEKKKLGKCRVQIEVALDAAEIGAVVKKVERVFVREARLPGFRPGKCPVELIRKRFAEGLSAETLDTMVRDNLESAVKESGVDSVGVTEIKDRKADASGGSFTAVVDVRPDFKLPSYKGLKIEFRDVKVADADVENQLARIREAYAKYEDAKEGDAVAKGDFAQIDYKGQIDSKPISEVAPQNEAKILAAGEGFWTQVEDGRFIPELLDALVGMKAGESKEVKVKFAKENVPEAVAGKKAVYSLSLKSFRRRILPDDAEFLEKTKAESIEKMTSDIREAMQKRADEDEARRREDQAVELLLKKADFDVPGSVVGRAADAWLEDFAKRAKYAGLDDGYFAKNREKILKDAEEHAEKQVRLFYLLDAIAKAENIASGEDANKKALDFVIANAKR